MRRFKSESFKQNVGNALTKVFGLHNDLVGIDRNVTATRTQNVFDLSFHRVVSELLECRKTIVSRLNHGQCLEFGAQTRIALAALEAKRAITGRCNGFVQGNFGSVGDIRVVRQRCFGVQIKIDRPAINRVAIAQLSASAAKQLTGLLQVVGMDHQCGVFTIRRQCRLQPAVRGVDIGKFLQFELSSSCFDQHQRRHVFFGRNHQNVFQRWRLQSDFQPLNSHRRIIGHGPRDDIGISGIQFPGVTSNKSRELHLTAEIVAISLLVSHRGRVCKTAGKFQSQVTIFQPLFKRYCRQPTSGRSADDSQSRFITSVVQPENHKLRQRPGFFLFDSTPGNLQTVRAMDTYRFRIQLFTKYPVRPFGECANYIILE